MTLSPSDIPEGMDYQFIATSVCGEPCSTEEFEKNGWRRVPRSRHLGLRTSDGEWITDGGLTLFERPKHLTERARVWEKDKADAVILSLGQVPQIDGFPINISATGIRKTTAREAIVYGIWIARSWFAERVKDILAPAVPTCTLWKQDPYADVWRFVFWPQWAITRQRILNSSRLKS